MPIHMRCLNAMVNICVYVWSETLSPESRTCWSCWDGGACRNGIGGCAFRLKASQLTEGHAVLSPSCYCWLQQIIHSQQLTVNSSSSTIRICQYISHTKKCNIQTFHNNGTHGRNRIKNIERITHNHTLVIRIVRPIFIVWKSTKHHLILTLCLKFLLIVNILILIFKFTISYPPAAAVSGPVGPLCVGPTHIWVGYHPQTHFLWTPGWDENL